MTRFPFALLAGGAMAAAAACFMTPAQAQPDPQDRLGPDPHQPWNDGSAAASVTVPPGAVARGYDPGTARLNRAAATDAIRADDHRALARSGYRADLAAYDEARTAQRQAEAMRRLRYARRQQAYARAMADWRDQAAACRDGDAMACSLPPPNAD